MLVYLSTFNKMKQYILTRRLFRFLILIYLQNYKTVLFLFYFRHPYVNIYSKILQFFFAYKVLSIIILHLFLHFRLMHFIAMFYSFVYVRVSFNGYNLEGSSHKIVTQIHSQVSSSFLLAVEKIFFTLILILYI